MLANLWMLKAPNGMFWYAADYLRALDVPTTVLMRPQLLDDARRYLTAPHLTVRAVGFATLARLALRAALRGEPVYCPTPHPIPWIRNQLVVFHDAYPFEGTHGARKLRLLQWGLASSGCRVGYINESMARPYLEGLGLPASRLVHAPNMPPPPQSSDIQPPRRVTGDGLFRLAAFGTDSAKKRYLELLEHLVRAGLQDQVELRLYGEDNAYVTSLRARFPQAQLSVCPPSRQTLQAFLAESDAVIGIAVNEGFGRPIATALMQGVPCYLSSSPTFREFFDGLAVLSDDINALLLAALRGDRPPAKPAKEDSGFLSRHYRAAIDAALLALRAMEQRAPDAGNSAIRHP